MADMDQKKRNSGEDEFGWEFHRGPIIAAIVITILFYILIFAYVAIDKAEGGCL